MSDLNTIFAAGFCIGFAFGFIANLRGPRPRH